MDFYEKLEFDRLIKELDFIESDLVYKSNVLKKADEDFMRNVNIVLNDYPQLKELFDNKNSESFQKIPEPTIIENEVSEELEIVSEKKDPKIKSLYRQIVRTTHPDVSSNLKEVFLTAQKAYDTNDLIQILSICDKLKISYEITNEEVDIVKEEINLKKQRIHFLESTYTWRWFNEKSVDSKVRIILSYLEAIIIK